MSACFIFYLVLIWDEHLHFRRDLLALSTFYSFLIQSFFLRPPVTRHLATTWSYFFLSPSPFSLYPLLSLNSCESPKFFLLVIPAHLLGLSSSASSLVTPDPALSIRQRYLHVFPSHAGKMPISHAQKTVNSRRADSHPPWCLPS